MADKCFKPKKTLARSPVRMEVSQQEQSVSQLESVSPQTTPSVRTVPLPQRDKRREAPGDKPQKRKLEEIEASTDSDSIEGTDFDQLMKEVGNLVKLVHGSTNTKKEIKECAFKILELAKDLGTSVRALYELSHPKQCNEIPTQTELPHQSQVVDIMADITSDDDLIRLLHRKWPIDLLQRLVQLEEYPQEGDTCHFHDIVENKSVQESRRYQAKPGEIKQDISTIMCSDASTIQFTRYTIFYDSSEHEEPLLKTILAALKRVVSSSAVPTFVLPGGKFGTSLRKIILYLLRQQEGNIKIYVRPGEGRQEVKQVLRTTPAVTDSGTVIVKAQGRSYADLLRTVKSSVSQEEVGDILSLKKGVNDDLYIRVQGSKKAAELKTLLKTKAADLKIDLRSRESRRTVVHVKGIAMDTTEEEITTALSRVLGEDEDFKLSSIRQAYGETKNVTVITNFRAAKKLTERRVRIGWVHCGAYIREPEERCFRCWSFGHVSATCKGVDRSQLCYGCGKAGHHRAQCKDLTTCMLCGKEGHRTGRCTVAK